MTNDEDIFSREVPLFSRSLVLASMVVTTLLGLIGITATAVAFLVL